MGVWVSSVLHEHKWRGHCGFLYNIDIVDGAGRLDSQSRAIFRRAASHNDTFPHGGTRAVGYGVARLFTALSGALFPTLYLGRTALAADAGPWMHDVLDVPTMLVTFDFIRCPPVQRAKLLPSSSHIQLQPPATSRLRQFAQLDMWIMHVFHGGLLHGMLLTSPSNDLSSITPPVPGHPPHLIWKVWPHRMSSAVNSYTSFAFFPFPCSVTWLLSLSPLPTILSHSIVTSIILLLDSVPSVIQLFIASTSV
jgi:hypothetical protein